jgi:hypothetical protein
VKSEFFTLLEIVPNISSKSLHPSPQYFTKSTNPLFSTIPLIRNFSPITEAYTSAYNFASEDGLTGHHLVTRAEYLESGSNASRRKFRDWKLYQESEKEKPANAKEAGISFSTTTTNARASGTRGRQQQQQLLWMFTPSQVKG